MSILHGSLGRALPGPQWQWSSSVLSVTPRGAPGTEPGRAGPSAQPISVPRDVKHSVIIPGKCDNTSWSAIQQLYLYPPPSHTHQHFAAPTALCCNSSFLLLVLNIMEISTRLLPSSLKAPGSSLKVSLSCETQLFQSVLHSRFSQPLIILTAFLWILSSWPKSFIKNLVQQSTYSHFKPEPGIRMTSNVL